MSRLVDRLRSGKLLLMDGAMGTELIRRGARPGEECLELWNLTRPHDVRALHRAYLDAGADCLLTNTFQANPQALARHQQQDRLSAIWQAALHLACDHPGHDPLVLASIGPFNGEPWPLFDACAGADGVLLETCSDAQALNHVGGGSLPLLVSFTFHRPDPVGPLRTFRNDSPATCAQAAATCGAVALGVNCGKAIDMDDLLDIVRAYRAVTDLPLFVRPNAGTPDARGHYPRTPDEMAGKLPALLEAGVTMVGGCCGTTPAHIAAFQKLVSGW